MIIDLQRFLDAGRAEWTELEGMLDRMESDPETRLSFEELRRFYHLYQRVSADLAKIQTFASEPEICRYLESLTGRAYAEINESRERGVSRRPWHWLIWDFPAAFRRHIRAFQLSLAVLMLGAIFGGAAVAFDPDAKEAIIPQQFSHLMGSPQERVHREETRKDDRYQNIRGSFATSLMQNNIRVSILLLAMGMTFGAGTILSLFYNGVLLGAVVVDYIRAHETAFVLGWLLPHGVIEIPAVLIAGQAGLLIGKTLIGGRERTTLKGRLREAGPDLLVLIGGVAAMLVWAGTIESFFSQVHEPVIPYAVKIAFGIVELVLLCWFLNRKPKGAE